MNEKQDVTKFNEDVLSHGGYVYAKTEKLSCNVANARFTKAILDLVDLNGKSVVDIGCGDGIFTNALRGGKPRYILGVDAAQAAVDIANSNYGSDSMQFQQVNVYNLQDLKKTFDVAIVRGVIHHLPDAKSAIREIVKIAHTTIILEPNGYNPILKIIEKLSKYHVEHEEQSYPPRLLDQWAVDAGGLVEKRVFANLVPMFWPDFFVPILKAIEPIVEAIPLVRNVCCGIYLQKITKGQT